MLFWTHDTKAAEPKEKVVASGKRKEKSWWILFFCKQPSTTSALNYVHISFQKVKKIEKVK